MYTCFAWQFGMVPLTVTQRLGKINFLPLFFPNVFSFYKKSVWCQWRCRVANVLLLYSNGWEWRGCRDEEGEVKAAPGSHHVCSSVRHCAASHWEWHKRISVIYFFLLKNRSYCITIFYTGVAYIYIFINILFIEAFFKSYTEPVKCEFT